MKILISVRSEVITGLLSDLLSEHDVHICDTGADAVSMLDVLRPELLILDLRLRGMDGITVLQEARHKPRYILALTDLITESILEAAADVGIQDVILIPCTIQHITKHLFALIEKAPSTEA
ncbi:MAG: response regulator [Oscillospiraceae bacterium]|nr:response regulator [Oscillospiraceae bacterium]